MFTHFQSKEELDKKVFIAAEAGNLNDVMKNLDGYIHRTNQNGDTLLHVAARKGHVHIVRYLLDHDADVNEVNPDGDYIRVSVASQKIEKEIDSKTKTDTDGKEEEIRIGRSALHLAAQYNHLEVAKLLLERGAKVDPRDKNSHTPLCHTLSPGHDEIAALLLKHNANANGIVGGNFGSFLHEATLNGHLKIVELLVNHGADINSTQGRFDKETPLHVALNNKHFEVAKFLVDNNAKTNIPDKNGKLPLALTTYDSYESLFNYELSMRAKIGRSCTLI